MVKRKKRERLTAHEPDGSPGDSACQWGGHRLTSREARVLEERLSADPSDLGSRLQLLGYYERHCTDRSPTAAASLLPHILWMIDNRPRDFTCYMLGSNMKPSDSQREEIRRRWMIQVNGNPNDSLLVSNAASSLKLVGDPTVAELRSRADGLGPRFPGGRSYAELLGDISDAILGRVTNCEEHAEKVLREADMGLRQIDDWGEYMGLLGAYARMAIQYNHLDHTRRFAEKLLHIGECGGFWHLEQDGYVLLIRIDLAEKSLEKVRCGVERLMAAVREHPSYADADDQTMLLLGELLDAGEAALVREYLLLLKSACENEGSREQLTDWIESLGRGDRPEFKRLHWYPVD